MGPHDGGRVKGGGSGVKAFSQILSEENLSY